MNEKEKNIKQKSNKKKFQIQNFYEKKEVQVFNRKNHNPNYKEHDIKIPFRMLVIGASGSGKTNVLTNLLNFMTKTFNTIYIFTRSLDEPLYDYIKSKLINQDVHYHEGIDNLNKINLDKYFSNHGQTLIIFDDLVLERNQEQIEQLFLRGRKIGGGISLCYLSQSYFAIPKFIRLQTNYLILRKIPSTRDLNMVLRDLSNGMTASQLQMLYETYVGESITKFITLDLNKRSEEAFKINFNDGTINLKDFTY